MSNPSNASSRRTFLTAAAGTGLIAAVGAGLVLPAYARNKANKAKTMQPIVNPLVLQRADPQIFRHSDGYYYMMASVPEYDRLAMRRAKTLAGLKDAEEVVVWRRPAEGRMGGYIWAPELHHFDGQWHIYFAAGNSDEKFHIRTYVLSSKDADPLTGQWSLTGQLETPWDTFTLDSTVFEHRGVRYIAWAQSEPGIQTNSNVYLAPLKTPTTLGAKPARLTVPTLPWEVIGYKVNEGPAILARNGRLFMTYSASATDHNYCMGLLTARDDADIMDPASWIKSPEPVFKSSPENNIWGPGHNSFTVDEQGRDVLVYHARDYKEIPGNPLFDPNRHTRIQPVRYTADGVPDFGLPVANGPLVG
ncbi:MULTISPECIES: family 43 glycosylhydrolase [Asticcacaulis]|uniref:glycoside hydrolase family 43 protein n=1 Tax=Asticcacaulis TaxID=76890 RepID=UPI001AE7AF30|nr:MULTISPECIES: glycoside hydrolase family 43 protein [Asticcacaulis]MBP2158463.1 GH43 family beta-xylosidase [Asticcacaulis solisilvae]MDR6799509.1 GH43 family beta-xylosidase [Asticcacaulis sp. BE141]